MNHNLNFNNINPPIPGMIPVHPQQYQNVVVNNQFQNLQQQMANTNVLASSVNLSSIQSLADLLIELPIPQETPQQLAKEQILITPNQQQKHIQHNLISEHAQFYLTERLANPLINAKQQMQDMNLNWTNTLTNNTEQNSDNEQRMQFGPQHETNAFLLKLMKDKNTLHEHVVLPPIKQQPIYQPVQTPQQFNQPPSVRQTRSQIQSCWNPFINDQQQQQSQLPPSSLTQQQQPPPSQQQFNNQELILQQQQPSIPHQFNNNLQFDQQNLNQNYQSPNLINNNNQIPIVENGQVNYQEENNIIENGQLNYNLQNNFIDDYSSLGDRVKSKKRSNKVQNTAVSPISNNHYAVGSLDNSLIQQQSTTPQHQQFNNNNLNNSNNNIKQQNNQNTTTTQSIPTTTATTRTPKSSRQEKSSRHHSENTPNRRSSVTNRDKERERIIKKRELESPTTNTPQLTSQNSTGPPVEKFESMLNELFNINDSPKRNENFDADTDDEHLDERKKKKKHKNKLNGENDYEDKSIINNNVMFLDITLSSPTLLHFINLTTKLKKSNLMKTIPTSKLTSLLTVLTQQIAVQSATLKNTNRRRESNAALDNDEEEDDEQSQSTSNMLSKFELCSDCCLVALNIMTSKGMSSKIYLEECIEQIVAFISSTISQYARNDTGTNISQSMTPNKKGNKTPKKSMNNSKSQVIDNKKVLFKMYNKWSELVSCLVELMNIHSGSLTDALVLATTRVAINAFFLENLNYGTASSSSYSSNEIQLNALNLTTVIFSQYNDHRVPILEEIIASISKLPKTKRGRVYYKVGDSDDKSATISMFSALIFKLIQCLFTNKNNIKQYRQLLENEDKQLSNNLENGNSLNKHIDVKESAIAEKQQKIKDLRSQYDDGLKISYTFLSSFHKKCVGASASSESDCRVLFEDLVSDLMVVLHKPNWPASQLITQTLIKLLINYISGNVSKQSSSKAGQTSNTQINSQLKLTSLDHLGTLCSRYAKELSTVDNLKEEIKNSLTSLLDSEFGTTSNKMELDDTEDSKLLSKKDRRKNKKDKNNSNNKSPLYNELLQDEENFVKELWKHLLRFLEEEKLFEEKNQHTAMWLREMEREFERREKESQLNQATNNQNDGELDNTNNNLNNQDETSNNLINGNSQEQFLKKARKFISIYKNAANPAHTEGGDYVVIDYATAEAIVKYFDVTQITTLKSFECALAHVIAALSTTSNTLIRSRAMKSLSTILNNAPQHYSITLLQRQDLQKATKAALLDASSSVREATIDLIGKFILNSNSEELIDSYYEIITERILDAGVSVRKRVIKILREICMTYPSYKRIPEICSKIIKRINDDGEGIRKLVSETFTSMWFKQEQNVDNVKLKVNCILHVVATVISDRIGTEWLNQLLTNLLTSPNDPNVKVTKQEDESIKHQSADKIEAVTKASKQIVDSIIGDFLCNLDLDQPKESKLKMFSGMTTIWLFGKVCPKLLVDHISTIQSYLILRCITPLDIMIMVKVVQVIENVLPKLSNPSESVLQSIEEELTKNIIQSSPQVLLVCVSCLSSLIHNHTKNRKLIKDLFQKFYGLLNYLCAHPEIAKQQNQRPKLLRSLFTCGLFAKYFDFIEHKNDLFNIMIELVNNNLPTIETDYRTEESYLTEFSTFGTMNLDEDFHDNTFQQSQDHPNVVYQDIDLDLLIKALTGLGFMFERNPRFSLHDNTQKIYKKILNREFTQKSKYPIKYPDGMIVKIASNNSQFEEHTICCVLKNLTNYLSDELNTEMSLQIEWSKENLKSMVTDEGDTNSVQSAIIQLYLDDVVKCTLSPQLNVRKTAVNLIHIIHNGGIVHPLQLVPYLIAMSSDDDTGIRARADHVLHEIERKYHGFVSMKAKHGITLSYQLHSQSGKRGFRIDNSSQNSNNLNQSGLISGQQSTAQSPSSAINISSTASLPNSEDQYIIARLSTLYSVVSSNRQSRRAFVGSLLKHFEVTSSDVSYQNSNQSDEKLNPGEILQFICDNLIWLPYNVWDEPLYILHQLELSISLNANQTHSLFKEILLLEEDDDDEIDETREPQKYAEKVNRQNFAKYQLFEPHREAAVKELNNCLKAFYLLNWSKQIFRELFGITDSKMQDYSPNEQQKVWDKSLHRKNIDLKTSKNLMNYPIVNVSINRQDLDGSFINLLNEYKNFKKIQLSGSDSDGFTKNSIELMKELLTFEQQDEEMLDTTDQASASAFENNTINNDNNDNNDTNTSKRKKKSKDKKHKKKKKKLRYSEEDGEEDSNEEDSNDSDYC